jgi:hypothetical protein
MAGTFTLAYGLPPFRELHIQCEGHLIVTKPGIPKTTTRKVNPIRGNHPGCFTKTACVLLALLLKGVVYLTLIFYYKGLDSWGKSHGVIFCQGILIQKCTRIYKGTHERWNVLLSRNFHPRGYRNRLEISVKEKMQTAIVGLETRRRKCDGILNLQLVLFRV